MADLIIINAKIWTANPGLEYAEAMAVKAGRILAIGSNSEISKFQNANTQLIDNHEGLVLPGFIDSHLHFLEGGFSLSSVQLKDAGTKQEFVRRIEEFAKGMKQGEWMLLGYWDNENWGGELPLKEWIDGFTHDIPVFLSRSDGHMALANTAALRAVDIDNGIKDPEGGIIERDENGNTTGIFKDNAIALISKHIPDYSDDQYSRALDEAMNFVAGNGITSVHHMGTLKDFQVFKNKRDSGKLLTRIYSTAPLWDYENIIRIKKELDDNDTWLKLNGAKIFADGSLGSKTAAFVDPYLDAPDEKGLLMDDEENMLRGLLIADSLGLQPVVHAIGDNANNIILNHYEKVVKMHGKKDRRFRIEHAQHLLASDIPRFKELGVIASMQAWHLMDDGRWAEKSIGNERAKTTYCFRSLLDAGTRLAFGSDWFVAPPAPLQGIYAAVTRHTLDGSHPDGWVPREKISLEEALRAYTIDAAYASFEEDIKGSLEPGKLADFVILDKDLFLINPDEIKNVKVLKTFVGGKLVFEYSTG